jgi:hypothetical protein
VCSLFRHFRDFRQAQCFESSTFSTTFRFQLTTLEPVQTACVLQRKFRTAEGSPHHNHHHIPVTSLYRFELRLLQLHRSLAWPCSANAVVAIAFELELKRIATNCVCSLLVCFVGKPLLPPRAKMSDEQKMSFSDRLLPRNYIPQLKDLAKQTHKARRAHNRMHFISTFVVLKSSWFRCCIPSLRLPCGRCLRTL